MSAGVAPAPASPNGLNDTQRVLKLVRSLLRPQTVFLDKFFPQVQKEESTQVRVDVEVGVRQSAPFVHPNAKAPPIDLSGFKSRSFTPPTMKLLAEVSPRAALLRAAGEQIGGQEMTAQERASQQVVRTVTKVRDMFVRAQEHMAISALVDNQIIVSGQGYDQAITLQFFRDPRLSAQLVGDAKWNGGAQSNPLQDIENMAEMVAAIEGALITDVYMDLEAWRWARRDPVLKEIIQLRRATGGNEANIGPISTLRGAKLVADMGDFKLWVYQDYKDVISVDATGAYTVTQGVPVLAPGTVIGVGPDVEGVRTFGAIENQEAIDMGEATTELFMDYWYQKNPGRKVIYAEAAPMPILLRPNACWSMKVFN